VLVIDEVFFVRCEIASLPHMDMNGYEWSLSVLINLPFKLNFHYLEVMKGRPTSVFC
jgi:hypothetical protein